VLSGLRKKDCTRKTFRRCLRATLYLLGSNEGKYRKLA
jgi:hypothetical protein